MTVVVIVGALLLLAIAVAAVAWPLLRERRGQPQAELAAEAVSFSDPLQELETQRDAIYQAIRELRFDRQVGKVSDADFETFDTQLRSRAALVLREMDALQKAEADPGLNASLEAEIAALRHVNGSGPAAPAQPAPVAGPVAVPAGAAALNFCPQCGQRLQAGDRFCGKCGTALN